MQDLTTTKGKIFSCEINEISNTVFIDCGIVTTKEKHEREAVIDLATCNIILLSTRDSLSQNFVDIIVSTSSKIQYILK